MTYCIKQGMKGFTIAILILLAMPVSAQTVSLEGEFEKQLSISRTDLEKLPPVEIKAKDKEGREQVYKGVNLFNVLQTAGIPATSKSFLSYIQVTGKDNYKVIFTLTELDPVFTSQQIVLAIEPASFRIVVPNDKKHARWVRDVAAIKLVTVR